MRRKELAAPHRRTVFLGEQGQKSVANFEFFDHGAEAGVAHRLSACDFSSHRKSDHDQTYP
jgi:hypothetical protein